MFVLVLIFLLFTTQLTGKQRAASKNMTFLHAGGLFFTLFQTF